MPRPLADKVDHFGVTKANWRDAAAKVPGFVAADPPVVRKDGRVFASWDLGTAGWKKLDDACYAYRGAMPYGMPG